MLIYERPLRNLLLYFLILLKEICLFNIKNPTYFETESVNFVFIEIVIMEKCLKLIYLILPFFSSKV